MTTDRAPRTPQQMDDYLVKINVKWEDIPGQVQPEWDHHWTMEQKLDFLLMAIAHS